jgi:hypothetical protein
MKTWTIVCVLAASLGYTGSVEAANYTPNLEFHGLLKTAVLQELMILRSHPAISRALTAQGTDDEAQPAQGNPLSDYETPFPHATQPSISVFEKSLLKAYLDSPDDIQLAKFLAIHHLSKALRNEQSAKRGRALQHRIIALYFLSRARDLGANNQWIMRAITKSQRELDAVFARRDAITLDENHLAHRYFRDAFHHHEANRYIASEVLLDDFVRQPRNVYTAFGVTALNLWTGSEADYADPTALYNFVVGSYFSIHTMNLAKDLEEAWDRDPAHNTRFRMASTLGGFSLLQRRWLAKLHGDYQAVQLVDDEHRQWRIVHRAFHAFTIGLPWFEEPQNFAEAKFAFEDAIAHCQQEPIRTCGDHPRLSFNFLSFILGYVDFLLKNGDVQAAAFFLTFRQPPVNNTYGDWDLGRGPFEHREQNLLAISELYRNSDPTDDPLNFLVKKRKWGMNTPTCQVCHQTQSRVWTQAEMDAIQLPPESVASVRVWPTVSTTWYGTVPVP